MSKLKPEDLDKIREKMARTMSLRDGEARAKIVVHMGTCGIAAGARKIMSTVLGLVEQEGAKDIVVTTSGCAGLCSREPMLTVELNGKAPVKYVDLDEEKTGKIFSDHVIASKVVKEYALAVGSERVG
ncbi:MAG: (2Fe-2S) ferredoxin domain-containing protein [Sedimentisphaerales bacterium]